MGVGERARRSGSSSPTSKIGTAAGAGFGAWIVGYVLTFVIVKIDQGMQSGGSSLAQPAEWKVVGWGYFGGHYVPIVSSGPQGSRSSQIVSGPLMDEPLLYLLLIVPPVVLIGAGYLVASSGNFRDPTNGAVAGALVSVVYFPLALVGAAVLFKWSLSFGGQSASVAPSLVRGVVQMGIAWPLVFGGIGGFLGSS